MVGAHPPSGSQNVSELTRQKKQGKGKEIRHGGKKEKGKRALSDNTRPIRDHVARGNLRDPPWGKCHHLQLHCFKLFFFFEKPRMHEDWPCWWSHGTGGSTISCIVSSFPHLPISISGSSSLSHLPPPSHRRCKREGGGPRKKEKRERKKRKD